MPQRAGDRAQCNSRVYPRLFFLRCKRIMHRLEWNIIGTAKTVARYVRVQLLFRIEPDIVRFARLQHDILHRTRLFVL